MDIRPQRTTWDLTHTWLEGTAWGVTQTDQLPQGTPVTPIVVGTTCRSMPVCMEQLPWGATARLPLHMGPLGAIVIPRVGRVIETGAVLAGLTTPINVDGECVSVRGGGGGEGGLMAHVSLWWCKLQRSNGKHISMWYQHMCWCNKCQKWALIGIDSICSSCAKLRLIEADPTTIVAMLKCSLITFLCS